MWGPTLINAPLAWGCETGDPNLKVAVIDHAFDVGTNPDLHQNPGRGFGIDKFRNEGRHGTAVASILAAQGNN